MRGLSIITGQAGNFPIWHPTTGFVNDIRISPSALTRLAGWPESVEPCVTVGTVPMGEGEPTEGDYESIGETKLKPFDGECWIFVLGAKLYVN